MESWAYLDEQFLQFTGLDFVSLGPFHSASSPLCLCCFVIGYCICCEHRSGGPDGIEIWSLRSYLPSVLWHCRLDQLIHKKPSPIWPIMCLVADIKRYSTNLHRGISTSRFFVVYCVFSPSLFRVMPRSWKRCFAHVRTAARRKHFRRRTRMLVGRRKFNRLRMRALKGHVTTL